MFDWLLIGYTIRALDLKGKTADYMPVQKERPLVEFRYDYYYCCSYFFDRKPRRYYRIEKRYRLKRYVLVSKIECCH